jgi:hypothetical protein
MPWLRRLLTCSLTTGVAALLAVLLSAAGGMRAGFDRLTGTPDGERPAVVAPTVVTAGERAGRASVTVAARPLLLAQASRPADSRAPADAWSPAAPALLRGSAGGPRAP